MSDPRSWADGDRVSKATLNTELCDRFRFLLGHSSNPFPHARVTSSVDVSLASSQWTTLQFDMTTIDRGGMFASGLGSALIAPIAGKYRIGCAVVTDVVACNKAVRIIINGSREVVHRHRPGVGSPVPMKATCATSVDLQAGDFIEAEVWHDFGSPINAAAGDRWLVLWARWRGL